MNLQLCFLQNWRQFVRLYILSKYRFPHFWHEGDNMQSRGFCGRNRQCSESTKPSKEQISDTWQLVIVVGLWSAFCSSVSWVISSPRCPLLLLALIPRSSSEHFYWYSYQDFKLITRKSLGRILHLILARKLRSDQLLGRIKHYITKDKQIFISLFFLSIDLFLSPI